MMVQWCAVWGLVGAMLLPALAVRAQEARTAQTALPHAASRVGPTDDAQAVTLAVPLKPSDPAAVDAFLRALADPASPDYHHYLTSAQFTRRFFAPADRQRVADYLAAQGLAVRDSGQGSVLAATGTVGQVSRAFNVTFADYRDAAGRAFFATDTTPALPVSIAPLIDGIVGLDTTPPARSHAIERPDTPSPRTVEPRAASGCSGAVSVANTRGSYTPNEFGTAYNFDALTSGGNRGEGQVVGLFELDDYADSNVATYQSCFGTAVPVSRVPVDGGATRGQSGGEIEVELDIDVVLGMAPRLGQLLVYESPNTGSGALDQLQRIANDNTAKVVSTSWGACETVSDGSFYAAENTIFQQMAAQGQSFFAASGDDGSEDCYSPTFSTALTVDDPASQPYVTGVGGTRLIVNSTTNAYNGETVWNDAASGTGAGGGGISAVWPKPGYQTGPGTVNSYSNGARQVPDVSADADPFTAYTVYVCSASCGGSGNCWRAVGGTSAAAPLWAAGTALINQSLQRGGLPPVGFANPTLYRLGAQSPAAFHDILQLDNCYIAGSCGTPNSGSGAYPATAGYDQASGIGSFNLGALAASIAPPTLAALSPVRSAITGGIPVTLTGTNFVAGATVSFGGVAATSVTVVNSTTITAVVPAHSAGRVDVTVTLPGGQSATLRAAFLYEIRAAAPTVPGPPPNPTAVPPRVSASPITGASTPAPLPPRR